MNPLDPVRGLLIGIALSIVLWGALVLVVAVML